MEGIIRLILLFFFLCGCQNGKITQIYQYQSYIDIDVKTESSYCFPNSIVMVGEENDSSTWYWNGDGPAEGFELIQILSVVKDSLNIHIERTYFNGNPEAFAVQTEILADTTFLGKMGNFKSLYVDLLKFQGDRGIEINSLPKYGEKSDSLWIKTNVIVLRQLGSLVVQMSIIRVQRIVMLSRFSIVLKK